MAQDPIAIIGLACRLPGGNSSPGRLWDFLEEGKVASNEVPASRFNFSGHWDGSLKPGTMRSKGGMFLSEQDVDLADFDASFFEMAATEALATDPNQRQLLEIVYEGLESAGVPMEAINGAPVACFVASFAVDYGDIQMRDPEDRPGNTDLGVGRAILANRISWFFNLKGPSVTIDTACSGSLVALDMACRTLRSREADAAIVAASNLYMSPEHVIDDALVGQAHSPTALCHSFDAAADGYVKAEAVSCLIVKRLETALRDRDPIRAVIRGIAINSNGRTNGIGSPSSEAQAAVIRKAYANAGIVDLNDTQYLECHGTGTKAGDAAEVAGIKAAFAASRDPAKPLIIGSIKSNVGHSEPAAGLSGLIKTILSLEHGMIPGTPSFINPNPNIDFAGAKVRVSRTMLPWPATDGKPRRASVNSFGYGGANAHAVLEGSDAHTQGQTHHVVSIRPIDEISQWAPDGHSFNVTADGVGASTRPYTLVLSANDAPSLQANIAALCSHLVNPRVRVHLRDVVYTLSQRRSHLWHRAFVNVRSSSGSNEQTIKIQAADFVTAKKAPRPPRVAFVMTGQGAQWSQMGRDLVRAFPSTVRPILAELDGALQGIAACEPPGWSLLEELTEPRDAAHLRQPELSQPLATALQICLLAVLEKWGVSASSVVGHSSGEIAAAYAAGYLDRAGAIKAAFFRGRAVTRASRREKNMEKSLGMLAVGLDADGIAPYLGAYGGRASIACYNSPRSLTISGRKDDLEALEAELKAAGHFARLLQVDVAYHSRYMDAVGAEYESLMEREGLRVRHPSDEGCSESRGTCMFSSVTASKITDQTPTDTSYWKANLLSPVRFDKAIQEMLSQPDHKSPDIIIEVGPSGALAGPISQILKSASNAGDVSYYAAWSRGADAINALFNVAGRLFITGAAIDLGAVNGADDNDDGGGGDHTAPRCVVDLPSYRWNHSVKYWYESAASKDWRFRRYVTHDLLGSKILGTPWTSPIWHKRLALNDVPWLRHHKMGGDVLMPGAAFCAMAVEAMYQKHCAVELHASPEAVRVSDLAYGLRNMRFHRALRVPEGEPVHILVALTKLARSSDDSGWHEVRISTSKDDAIVEHCTGMIRVQEAVEERLPANDERRAPLRSPQPFRLWHKTQREVGMDFGPSFQKTKWLEATSGQRSCRAMVDLTPPSSAWNPPSHYSLHPAVMDSCFQTLMAPNAANERSLVKEIQIPALADEAFINRIPRQGVRQGLVLAQSRYSGRGRPDQAKGIIGDVSTYDAETGDLLVQLKGLHYVKLDVDPKPDAHVFDSVQWKPDITLLTQAQLGALGLPVSAVIDLLAHKRPRLRVLEVNLNGGTDGNVSSLWLDAGEAAARQACSQYDFASSDAEGLVAAQRKFGAARHNVGYLLASPEKPGLGLETALSAQYDLAILHSPHRVESAGVISENLEPLLSDGGLVVVVESGNGPGIMTFISPSSARSTDSRAASSDESNPNFENGASQTSQSDGEHVASSATSLASADAEAWKTTTSPAEIRLLDHVLTSQDGTTTHHLYKVRRAWSSANANPRSAQGVGEPVSSPPQHRTLMAIILGDITEALQASTQPTVSPNPPTQSGWTVTHVAADTLTTVVDDTSIILVPDELLTSVLADPSPAQWAALQALFAAGRPILWLTAGGGGGAGQHPERAMAHGLFRVVRRELASQEDRVPRVVLDVDAELVGVQVQEVEDHAAEAEYRLRRDGVLEVPRLVPDAPVNEFRRFDLLGQAGPSTAAGLWETERMVRLRGDRVGSLDLTWWECEEEPLQEGYVEVDVEAVGVNFKDVAAVMGIIPEDEHMIGCECAGVVRQLGPGVTKVKVGDRVVVLGKGFYANRIRSIAHCVHVIPSWMSFEEAATIPLAYSTAIQALLHLGNLQEGQSVLIHSAAGGVGLAALQLAQYKKAEVFVTVGTDEKRDFLSSEFGIAQDHMFSSRNSKFAEEILAMTNGRGVDVVINSLTGDMLDASWRIVADGGTMIEIGKRDILDRNALAMEPFGRNCSFRALDFSSGRTLKDARLLGELMGEIFTLIEGGHIGPIRPITAFGFDKVSEALAYMRRGQHIGKLVVAKGPSKSVQVPIRPLPRALKLRQDVSYLIVGGIKGLCGSLALHMARHGARHLIVCSRSGIDDETSARIVRGCRSYGCEVTGQKGDVCDMAFVRRVFESVHPRRIAGVIQGAMVLKDKPFQAMGLEDYRDAVAAKVSGTWNLHRASLEDALSSSSSSSSSSSRSLDFFTLLSSVSGVVGNKGQANYAAANAFLDAFAAHRRSLGLPAHALDLGAVDDAGYIAEQEAAALAGKDDDSADGTNPLWTPLNEQALRTALTVSILQQQARPLSANSQLVTGIAHPLTGGDLENDPRFGYVLSGANGRNDVGSGQEDDIGGAEGVVGAAVQAFALLRASGNTTASAQALEKAAVAALAAQTARILRLETEVEVGKPLSSYGFDSLSAVELRGWIRARLGAEVSTLDVTGARSLVELGEKVVAKISQNGLQAQAAAAAESRGSQ
ncbi:polyketide synthase [Thermothielavioides terrestris NRRL 8126]|uniref:Polyketide synthase n=1 Tax=Thermothielavioides terrestris (strain ATCC 38088 / NRRL 8126) TaxID=578455 RepID=G2QUR1_THETT|nr:polyketide synthase [Thermothielavioides terrestris NRRL 8126]AEO62906.1 polyketide synthase [Thermothielavioides terrestris NRRL 8126]